MVQSLYDLFVGTLKNRLKFYNLGNKSELGGFETNNKASCVTSRFPKPETEVIFCY